MRRSVLAFACATCFLSPGPTLLAGVELPEPVVRGTALRTWVRLAMSARADIVCIGDSNQAYTGHGWDHGVTRAAGSRFGLFATGLHAAGENQGWGLGLGYASSVLSTACCVPQFDYDSAPEPLNACMDPAALMVPMNYLHLGAGQQGGGAANLGLQVWGDSPISVNARLAYEVTYGVSPSGAGVFQPSVRLGQPPYSLLALAEPVSTSAPLWGWSTATVEVPAGTRNAALNARFTPWGTDMVGPVALFTHRMVNMDRTRGAAVSTLYARGSQSARDMAAAFLAASDDQLTLFFSRVRASQGAEKGVLVRINSGLNDQTEDQPSLGPAGILPGNSPLAFSDNLLAIVTRLQALWALNSWPESELHFLFVVSHPVSSPDAPALDAYREAADALVASLPRAAAVNLSLLTTADEMLASNWYQLNGADRFHLTQPAFETLAARELDAVIDAACLADLNTDGRVDTADLVGFLGKFGVPTQTGTGADLVPDGTVNTADLVLFLGSFGRGCL